MCCCYCKSRFSKFPLISGVTKTLFNMVKKFEVNRTILKFSIICSLETYINQRDQTFLARSIRARITREKFLHVQKNVNIHTVKSVKSIRNILWHGQTTANLSFVARAQYKISKESTSKSWRKTMKAEFSCPLDASRGGQMKSCNR